MSTVEIFSNDKSDLSTIFSDIEKPSIQSDEDKKELSSDDYPYSLSLYQSDFSEEKDKTKFIKSCERMVRMSPEYKVWVHYLREVMGQYVCGITNEVNSETSVEIHHHPFCLYDIVKAVCMKYISSGKEFCSFDIVKDVLEIHYENNIGYIPLVASLHEKFHNGCLDIPMELISGNWKTFKHKYVSYLDDDDLDRINARIGVTLKNCSWKDGYNWTRNNYVGDK